METVQPASGLVVDGDGRVHRPAAARCAAPPALRAAPVDPGGRAEGARCDRDADCNQRPYGSCDAANQLGIGACVYGCAADADCGSGKLCVCGDGAGRCVSASCRADAECGSGQLCARYFPVNANRAAFACTTARDECHRDCACDGDDGVTRVCDLDQGARRCIIGGRRVH